MRAVAAATCLLVLAATTFADPPSVETDREDARTLPLPKGDDVFHFVVYGDRTGGSASGINVLKDAVRETNLLDPDLVMTVGDLIQGYNRSESWMAQMKEYRGVMGKLRMPWYPVAGNHDIYWRGGATPMGHHEKEFETHFGPLWYSFRHKNAAFVVLYSDEGDRSKNRKGWRNPDVNQLSKEQLAWLGKTLDGTKDADHVFVFLHHPKWRTEYYRGSNWAKAHSLLKDAGNVSAVFAGHMHRRQYHGQRDGIDYYTLAAVGGAMPFNIPGTGHLHHMDVVTVRADGYKVATIPVGSVLDPKEMTPERLEDIDQLRRLDATWLNDPLVLTVDGMAAGDIGVAIENPCTQPIMVHMTVDARDRAWRFSADHLHKVIEPGKRHVFPFRCYRREREGLDGFQMPRLLMHADYLGPTLRVELPEQVLTVPVKFGNLPGDFFRGTENRAVALDGKNACLSLTADQVDLPDGPFTIEGWLCADSYKGRRGFITKTENSEYGIFVSNGQPGFSVLLGSDYVSAEGKQGSLEAGKWTHLAGVYDGAEVRMYVDGRLIASTKGSGKRKRNRLPLYIGADVNRRGNPMSHVEGLIDEVRLSTVARYTGESFDPPKRCVPDADTFFLFHFDQPLGPFAADHSAAGRHAHRVGRLTYEPLEAAVEGE